MSLQAFSPQVELDHCRAREREERAAGLASAKPAVRDTHLALAERYADQAWSISEAHDLPYDPSGLWQPPFETSDRVEVGEKPPPTGHDGE